MEIFDRVKLLIGEENFAKLNGSSVALFGVGGVGGYVAEALVRSGIGGLTIFDGDVVGITNVNRQIIADLNTVGKCKTEVIKDRLLAINKDLKINCVNKFIFPEDLEDYDFSKYDYVIDAIDTVSTKIAIIVKSNNENVPVISCMGTGGKLDATKLKVSELSQTKYCPLARVVRRELKKKGDYKVKTVYSEEKVFDFDKDSELTESKGNSGRKAPPSMIFVPATAGLLIANVVVKDVIGLE